MLELTIHALAMLLLAGSLAGTVFGAMGVGGGYVVIPYLVYLMNFPIHEALGTNMLVSLVGASASAIQHYRRGQVRVKQGFTWAFFAVVGAYVGAHLACESPAWLVRTAFGGSCILVAALTFMRSRLRGGGRAVENVGAYAAAGFLLGAVSGFVGVPGGIFYAAAFVLAFNLPMHAAAGTAAMVMPFTALSGATRFYLSGFVSLSAAAAISFSTAIVAWLSARFSDRLPAPKLRRAFAAYLVYVGVVMLLGLRP